MSAEMVWLAIYTDVLDLPSLPVPTTTFSQRAYLVCGLHVHDDNLFSMCDASEYEGEVLN